MRDRKPFELLRSLEQRRGRSRAISGAGGIGPAYEQLLRAIDASA